MGFFERVFGKKEQLARDDGHFKLLNGYTPIFRNWSGKLYESELVRASIDAIARHVSKLQFTTKGSARKPLKTQLEKRPNDFQTWSQFLYRVTSILYVTNTCFIVPRFGDLGEIIGIHPIAPASWELVEASGEPWIRFKFNDGKRTAFRLEEVGILTRHQYSSELFGEDNSALGDTMRLIDIQRQAIKESAKNSASYKFMARVNNFTKAGDLKEEARRFDEHAFQGDGGGMLLFPNTYSDIRELTQRAYNVDREQLALIQTNVYNYMGVNEDIIQNKAYGDAWSAFYEGCIEPMSTQLSEVLTKMLFSDREIGAGNQIYFTANRLQYMSNADKLSVSTQMLDRGIFTINQVLEMWNLPGIGEEGDVRIIRGEYYNADEKLGDQTTLEEEENE